VNNLKQLGLAIQNYNDANGALPPTADGTVTNTGFALKPRLLPFLEQTALFNATNFMIPYSYPQNWTIETTTINAFLCPSDGNIPSGTSTLGSNSAQVGYVSYPNNIGTFAQNFGGTLDGPAYILGGSLGPTVTFATITDGLSNTVIFSETLRGRGDNNPGRYQIYTSKSANASATPLSTLYSSCLAAPNTPIAFNAVGGVWLDDNCGKGGCYSHIMTPNKKSCWFSNATLSKNWTMLDASSNHSGGVNCGFLDGSVKFVKDAVSQQTWWAIATKSAGEVVDASSY
jgi:prepilin-type processing-associated H-X9-DG protein